MTSSGLESVGELPCPQCGVLLENHRHIGDFKVGSLPAGGGIVTVCAHCREPAIYEFSALTGAGRLRSPNHTELASIYAAPEIRILRDVLKEFPPPRAER